MFDLPPRATEAAFARLKEVNKNRGSGEKLALRVAVLGGGCSGFRYDLSLVQGPEEDDFEIPGGESAIYIDRVSLPFLSGAVVNFERSLSAQRFTIENPGAISSCGCGESFSFGG